MGKTGAPGKPAADALDDSAQIRFRVQCSNGHGDKGKVVLGRGVLHAPPGQPPSVAWEDPPPPASEPRPDGSRCLHLRCWRCGRIEQLPDTRLITAVRALAAAGLRNGAGNVVLEASHLPGKGPRRRDGALGSGA